MRCPYCSCFSIHSTKKKKNIWKCDICEGTFNESDMKKDEYVLKDGCYE